MFTYAVFANSRGYDFFDILSSPFPKTVVCNKKSFGALKTKLTSAVELLHFYIEEFNKRVRSIRLSYGQLLNFQKGQGRANCRTVVANYP